MTDDNQAAGPLSDPTQIMRPARHAAPGPPTPAESDPPATGIIRRAPTGAIPIARPDAFPDTTEAPGTSIIRRTPTGAIPIAATQADSDAPATNLINTGADPATGLMLPGLTEPDAPATSHIAVPRRSKAAGRKKDTGHNKDAGPKPPPGPSAACATATASVLSGWATAVIATSLIAGWWHTDRLFCVAVGFLAALSATATIGGQIAVLLRRRTGRVLVVVGSVVALMIFASLFVAGAQLPPIVYGIPILPITSIALATLPVTGRWCTKT